MNLSTPPVSFSAAVLAGGRSTRMGTDKAFVLWRGRTLLEHQLSTLRALGPNALLVSRPQPDSGRRPDGRVEGAMCNVQDSDGPSAVPVGGVPSPRDPSLLEPRIVFDERPDCGPLGGLGALLKAIQTSHLIVLAVDMPRVTPVFLRLLSARCAPGVGSAVRTETRWEPLVAVYPRELLPWIERRLVDGDRSLQKLLDEACLAGQIDPVRSTSPRLFANINTPAELTALANT